MFHQRILAKSPVLARMTTSGFSESITKEIILPEDEEDMIGRIIEFLYGNQDDPFDFSKFNESDSIKKLTDMFTLTDKYELFNIQGHIIVKLEEAELLKNNKMTFFNTTYRITQNSHDSHGHFYSFFTKRVAAHLRSLTTEETKKLSDMAESGGSFAKWMLEAQARLYQEDQQRWFEDIVAVSSKLSSKEVEFNAMQKSRTKLKAQSGKMQKSRAKFKAHISKHIDDKSATPKWILEVLAWSEI